MTVYPIAPIKRMSILERRPGDDRALFLRHWHDVHGGMVSGMPHLYAYAQNHVVEDFPAEAPGIPADGIVEQLWRSTAEMQRGYNSPVVKELIADEVNYLGHGSNYAILAQAALREAPSGNKILIALRHGGNPELSDALAELASGVCDDVLRDDVIATIAKVNFLPVPPRPVDMFLHLFCADAGSAGRTGRQIAESAGKLKFSSACGFGAWRIATRTVVAP